MASYQEQTDESPGGIKRTKQREVTSFETFPDSQHNEYIDIYPPVQVQLGEYATVVYTHTHTQAFSHLHRDIFATLYPNSPTTTTTATTTTRATAFETLKVVFVNISQIPEKKNSANKRKSETKKERNRNAQMKYEKENMFEIKNCPSMDPRQTQTRRATETRDCIQSQSRHRHRHAAIDTVVSLACV